MSRNPPVDTWNDPLTWHHPASSQRQSRSRKRRRRQASGGKESGRRGACLGAALDVLEEALLLRRAGGRGRGSEAQRIAR
eukprot:899843-Rhodomonas_salina.1